MRRSLRIPPILLAALAIASASIDTATASAVEFTLSTEPCNGTIAGGCWANKSTLQELVGEQSETLKGGPFVLETIISTFLIEIKCGGVSGVGETWKQPTPLIAKTSSLEGRIEFTSCKLGPAELAKKCSVPETIETASLTGKFETTAGAETIKEELFQPTTGTTVLELVFTNTNTEECSPKLKEAAHPVVGFQAFTIVSPETVGKSKTTEAVASSGLKILHGEPVSLTGAITYELTGNTDEWSIVKQA